MNPLNFTRMEWWSNQNENGFGHMCVGFTDSGSTYLTLDIRKTGGFLFPVFSTYCEVGSKEGHRQEAYEHYRELFGVLDGYSIKPLKSCQYGILNDVNTYKFIK